jgi:hypothetical protein
MIRLTTAEHAALVRVAGQRQAARGLRCTGSDLVREGLRKLADYRKVLEEEEQL